MRLRPGTCCRQRRRQSRKPRPGARWRRRMPMPRRRRMPSSTTPSRRWAPRNHEPRRITLSAGKPMIRILIYLLLLAAVAYGADWLLQRPGHIDVTWAGYHITTSAAVGFALIVLLAVVLMVAWSILRFIFG